MFNDNGEWQTNAGVEIIVDDRQLTMTMVNDIEWAK